MLSAQNTIVTEKDPVKFALDFRFTAGSTVKTIVESSTNHLNDLPYFNNNCEVHCQDKRFRMGVILIHTAGNLSKVMELYEHVVDCLGAFPNLAMSANVAKAYDSPYHNTMIYIEAEYCKDDYREAKKLFIEAINTFN